ncbi:uncharacterized protein LOC129566024 [Sitodiplosis mosellana]|uniref:uncharacterized protein LOC129566024 n=1 Tax=Sitodiplosis mosellana TaxID=263140 RepID=UPI00244386BD|nr:uncharacterized protein LOC129566024 [Sitodiplosis mosellana]
MALAISEINFPLTIPNISNLDRIQSSEIVILGIPWQVEIFKEDTCMGVSFRCAKKDNSSQWSYAAETSVKLLSFDRNQSAFEKQYDPYIFCNVKPARIDKYFISWANLFEANNKSVKNDTIQLEFKIKVADPNDVKKSIMIFKPLYKCCEDSVVSVFKLTVTNIDALMAVRTPSFIMRNNPWALIVYKGWSNSLFAGLLTGNDFISCNVRVLFKLMSSKANVGSKEVILTESMFTDNSPAMRGLVSWKDLFDAQNGFVNNNSVVIEVEIIMGKPKGTASLAKKRRAANPLETGANLVRLECAICLNNINKDDASSTKCGHIFCTACIKGVIQNRKRCPSCNSELDLDNLHRVYLPVAN